MLPASVLRWAKSAQARPDGYWAAYIVKGRKTTQVKVQLTFSADQEVVINDRVDSVWVDVHWVNYGPFGRLHRRQGMVVPTRQPEPLQLFGLKPAI